MFDESNLTAGEVMLVKWQYNMLVDFYKALFEAIARADGVNLYKLSLGFPEEVLAFKRFSYEEGYWEDVEVRAKLRGRPIIKEHS